MFSLPTVYSSMVIVCRSAVFRCLNLIISPGSSEKPAYFDKDEPCGKCLRIVKIMNVNLVVLLLFSDRIDDENNGHENLLHS